jgi:dipeptidase E
MKFYLSSSGFGNEVATLQRMLPAGSRIGHIVNAQDRTGAIPAVASAFQLEEMEALNRFGYRAEALDLRTYFGKAGELSARLSQLDGLWVSGGNTFVLRWAMRLSGFDGLFPELRKWPGFFYGGSSAGICVLCDSLKYIQNVDDPYFVLYDGSASTMWEGLDVFDHGILPHYRSSRAIKKAVQACIDKKWLFKALRDGEVIVLEE